MLRSNSHFRRTRIARLKLKRLPYWPRIVLLSNADANGPLSFLIDPNKTLLALELLNDWPYFHRFNFSINVLQFWSRRKAFGPLNESGEILLPSRRFLAVYFLLIESSFPQLRIISTSSFILFLNENSPLLFSF